MNTTRIICLVIAVCTAVTLFGCTNGGNGGGNTVDTEPKKTAPPVVDEYSKYPEQLGVRNYEDKEFIIATLDTDELGLFTLHTEGYNSGHVNDAMYERDMAMNDKYGITVKYELCSTARDGIELRDKVNTNVTGETHYCDMISGNISYVLQVCFNMGTLYNIEELPAIDSEKPWWAGYIWDNVAFNDKLYYTAGTASGGGYYATPYAMACNIKLASEITVDNGKTLDIFDMVNSGDWTLENFFNIIENYSHDDNGDGEIDVFNDRLAYAHMRSEITAQSHYVAAGMKFSEITSDGELIIDISSDKVFSMVDRLSALFDVIVDNYDEESFFAEDSQQPKVFMNDKALFFGNSMSYVEKIKDMTSDYAVIPCPKSDKEQTNYYTGVNTWTPGFIGFAKNIEDDEFVGYSAEMLGYESYRSVKPVVYNVILCARIARDPRQIEIMDMIYNGIYLDLNYINNIAGSTMEIAYCIMDRSRGFASSVAGISRGLEKSIQKFVNDMQ